MKTFDVIIIGAGSVGLPLAWSLSGEKVKVLVIEKHASCGQGQNKAAVGGIRATHSDAAKIMTCKESLKIFSTWKETYGDDIGWIKGGYSFPAYSESHEKTLKDLLKIQKKFDLNIEWVDSEKLKKIIPGINPIDLRGGTYSHDDGHLSPLLTAQAFQRIARKNGATFNFSEQVTGIKHTKGKVKEVKTSKSSYQTENLVIASGAEAADTGKMLGLEIPVVPDSHEGGITEPVKRFFDPLIVDMRERPGTKNFYFYQNQEGQIVFCVTPQPIIEGRDIDSTSAFLPQAARRLIEMMPRLKNIKIRRTWRGLYPMTPDGVPIVDEVKEKEGLYLAVGMCGQGLMLGPALALNLTSMIIRKKPRLDREIFKAFSLCREFSCVELLK